MFNFSKPLVKLAFLDTFLVFNRVCDCTNKSLMCYNEKSIKRATLIVKRF